ncbi:MAG: TatD family hydrolase [Brevinematales bacterium]|nr:TatD family hydrolase [Brevinematales bacterium]
MYVDTHFHLNMLENTLQKQRDAIDESISKGVIGGINIYTSVDEFLENLEIFEYLSRKNLKVACGWYPEYTPTDKMIEDLENVLKSRNIFAIGEIGLEYYRMYKPKDDQLKLFELQMILAEKYKKPVIIHSRDAYNDTYSVLKKFPSVRGIIHCFTGTPEIAKKFLDIGYYISFAGNLTFKNALDIQSSAKYVPLDMVFFETDSPFLAPTPFRGQKNYPYLIKYTYEFASNLLGIPIDKLQTVILENWNRFIRG